jgi:hypothetical protein
MNVLVVEGGPDYNAKTAFESNQDRDDEAGMLL